MEEEARQAALRCQQQQQLPWAVAPPLPYSQGSHASAADWSVGAPTAGAQQTAAPPAQQQHQWSLGEASKSALPAYSGGWDAGPAAVAAANGRSSSASAGPPADTWQQPAATQPTGLLGAALSPSASTCGPGAAVALQPAGPALPDGWGAPSPQLPLAKQHSEGGARLGPSREWEARPPLPAHAAVPEQSSELEDLMAMMGILRTGVARNA